MRRIFAESFKKSDISLIRKLMKEGKNDKEIHRILHEKMVLNSESMANYIKYEKISSIMHELAKRIHWNLIYQVTEKVQNTKKELIRWDKEKNNGIIEERIAKLKERFFDKFGKFKPVTANEKEIDAVVNELEKEAEKILKEIKK